MVDEPFECATEPGEFYRSVGVGPHPLPWPEGHQWDHELLANGDRRNVVDKYRYWTVEAIKAHLDKTRSTLHVAIENWQHDLNIGSIVRTANAFNVAAVHIIGHRRWNRRGAMVTDKYMHIRYHANADLFRDWSINAGTSIVGIEQKAHSQDLSSFKWPSNCVIMFGSESRGLCDESLKICDAVVEIPQNGSTRSLNAAAAGAIILWQWNAVHRRR